MSDIIGTVLGVASAIDSLFGGAALSLGSVNFEGFEVPEKVPFGGQQQLTVHKLPGGGRVIHAMGPDDKNIEWSGYFRGPLAVSRARQVDAMRTAGAPISLTWADFRRKVVIASFECDYTKGGFLLPYKVSCVVVPQTQAAPKPGLLQQLTKDIGDSLGIKDLAADAQKAISVAQAALPIIGTVTKGVPLYVALSSGIGSAQSVVGGIQAVAEGQLSGLSVAATAAGGVFGGASGLTAGAAAARDMASAAAASGLLARAGSNLSRTGA